MHDVFHIDIGVVRMSDLLITNVLNKYSLNKWVGKILTSQKFSEYMIMQKKDIVCRNCGKKQIVKQNERYLTFLCKCGCRIYYPPNEAGIVVTKFISREDYEAKKNAKTAKYK